MKTILISASLVCIAMCGCRNGTVTSVKIEVVRDSSKSGPDIESGRLEKSRHDIAISGSTMKLKAILEGTGKFDPEVVWSIKDGSGGSKISDDGVLSISPEMSMISEKLNINATSKQTPEVSGNLILTIVNDVNAFKGKWVRSWNRFQDTIIVNDKSFAVKVSNGNSFSVNKTKWVFLQNSEILTRDEFPSGFHILGLVDKAVLKNYYAISRPMGIYKPELGEKITISLMINKEKSKIARFHINDGYLIYDRVQ